MFYCMWPLWYRPQTDTSSLYLAVNSAYVDEIRDPACGSDSFKQFLTTILFSLYIAYWNIA